MYEGITKHKEVLLLLKQKKAAIVSIKKLLKKITNALQIRYYALNYIKFEKSRAVPLGKAKYPWLVDPIDPIFHLLETLLSDEIFQWRGLRKRGRILLKQLVIDKGILKILALVNFDKSSDIIDEYTYTYDYKYTYTYDYKYTYTYDYK